MIVGLDSCRVADVVLDGGRSAAVRVVPHQVGVIVVVPGCDMALDLGIGSEEVVTTAQIEGQAGRDSGRGDLCDRSAVLRRP